jgi:hypothetical protein
MVKTWLATLAVALLVACAPRSATGPAPQAALPAPGEVLPDGEVVPGWSGGADTTTYDRDSLYDFMNGAADLYFTYGFEELAVGGYRDVDENAVQVEVYRLATDADAYGLFAYNAYGEPVDVGVDGTLAGGDLLAFWQSRTFVQVVARNRVDDGVLLAFAGAVASALPQGGVRPALVEALPAGGMVPGSARFFREKMALDNLLWLGAEDVLGLGADVEGALARYGIDGRDADLVLIAYPDARRADTALSALRGAGLEDLVLAEVREGTLGAVFGQVDEGTAAALLEKALAAIP